MDQAILSGITLYPIKALDGIAVSSAAVMKSGTLEHDREFAILNETGKFVRGKSSKRVHLLRSQFNFEAETVTLAIQGEQESSTFHLHHDRRKLESWLSNFFGFRVYLIHNSTSGYPDDKKTWGPTIVSEASLEKVASWFLGLTAQDVWQRFRPNVVLSGVEAFGEDRLFGEPGSFVEFHIGSVKLEGSNPCARCVVPTRNPETSKEHDRFQKTFAELRKKTLPSWATTSRFDHFYRFCVNTRIHPNEAGKMLQVGDEVKIGV